MFLSKFQVSSKPSINNYHYLLKGVLRFESKSSSSHRWLNRQKEDHFTKQSKIDHYRSRAAYKLLEIDDRFKLFNSKSSNILDLGFSPGAWTQVALQRMRRFPTSNIVGVDIIKARPPEGSTFIHGDILSKKTHMEIKEHFKHSKTPECQTPVNLILSDIMSNTSGNKDSDHYASMHICDAVLILTCNILKKDGNLVVKFYTGSEDTEMESKLRKLFRKVYRMKPSACRPESREMYFIALKKRNSLVEIETIF